MIRQAKFVLRLALQDLTGNWSVHAVGGAIISAAFLTVGLFVLVAVNLEALTKFWEKRIQVSVYLADAATEGMRSALQTELYSLAGVEKVEYVNKEQAMAEFKAMLGEDGELLEGIDDNPLPASFIVQLAYDTRELDKIKAFASQLAARPGVESVDYGGAWLESFAAAVRIAQGAVLVLGALIVLSVVFIISNTIRLTMFSRKEEIGIMKLVGASNLLIRLPFVLEGVGQGAAASLLGVAGLWLIYFVALDGSSWPGVFAGFTPVFISGRALVLLVASGAGLGALGSLSRVSDFLRV